MDIDRTRNMKCCHYKVYINYCMHVLIYFILLTTDSSSALDALRVLVLQPAAMKHYSLNDDIVPKLMAHATNPVNTMLVLRCIVNMLASESLRAQVKHHLQVLLLYLSIYLSIFLPIYLYVCLSYPSLLIHAHLFAGYLRLMRTSHCVE